MKGNIREPKLESLWRTSTHKSKDGANVGGGRQEKMPFVEVFDLLGCRFRRNQKRFQGMERTFKKVVGNWWRDAHMNQPKNVSVRSKYEWVVS